jgi:hypothetical protein
MPSAREASQVVIDSSAFDRLSLARLEDLATHADLLVSPLSLYEILCHLDDPARNEEVSDPALSLRESRLKKCQLLQRLDDHFAEEGPFAAVGQWIDELVGGTASCDVTAEAARALAEARRTHARRSIDFTKSLLARVGRDRALSLTAIDFVRVASDGMIAAKREAVGLDDLAFEDGFFSAAYPSAGYRLARSVLQLRSLKLDEDPVFDPADMEDAHLCLHLNLHEPIALVTAHAQAREALTEALTQLDLASKELGSEVVALTTAIDVNELR